MMDSRQVFYITLLDIGFSIFIFSAFLKLSMRTFLKNVFYKISFLTGNAATVTKKFKKI